MTYETRRDMIIARVWGEWTDNRLGLDSEDREETTKTVRDAVNNSYCDGISDIDWLAETLMTLSLVARP